MASPVVKGSDAVADVPAADILSKVALSAREQEVLMAAWLSIKGDDPQVDYGRLAQIMGLKNAASASTTFYNLRKKIKQFRVENCGDVETPPSPVKKAATPRKRAAKDPAMPKAGRGKRVKFEEQEETETEAKEAKEIKEVAMTDEEVKPERENAV